jgi:hypothetical protein
MHVLKIQLAIIKNTTKQNSYTNNNNNKRENLSLYKATPIGCRPRKFHPTIDTTAPNINNSVTLRARAMNPQGRFQSVTWVLKPVSSQALKLSQVFQHAQQSKYLALFYPSCATQENGPPPFSTTQSIR